MKWFFGLSVGGADSSLKRTWELLMKTITHPFLFLKTVFNFKWSTTAVIFLVMQSVDNAMKMIWKKSLFGGRMKIDNHGNKKVPAFIPVGQEVMERYAEKILGSVSQNIVLEVFFNRPTTTHILGGCPMSDNIETGVVDKNLQVHGYPGFYITDRSVIQGNIGVNPSLTIAAMAEYCMSNIPSVEGSNVSEITKQLIYLEEEWKKKRSV
jgi:cholesterol oxidase